MATRYGLIITAGWLAVGSVAHAEIYRWVDEEGRVYFGDTVPADLSKVERHVLDKQGNLRNVLRRQRTVAELEQHRARMEAMTDEKERRGRQEQYDTYLWTTFASLEDLEELRKERLEIADDVISGMEQERRTLEGKLIREQARRSSNTIAQQTQLRNLEQQMAQIDESIGVTKVQHQSEFAGLSKDMQRYEYLRLQRAMYAPR